MQWRNQARIITAVVPIVLVAFPSAALAHFNLLQPPPADNATDGGKGAPPCGPTSPSNVVTPVQGGHPLAISLSETVMHPGHYRFALSINSRSEIPPDPDVVVKSGMSVSAAIENPAVFPVLADDVFDHTTGTAPISWTTSLVLPNVTCAKCTLQVIEFMAEPGSNPGGGYFYHHCADLQITADPSLPLADAGAPAADASASGGAGGNTGGRRDGGADARGSGGASGSTGGTHGGAGGLASGSGGSVDTGDVGGTRGTGGATGGSAGGSSGSAGSVAAAGSGGAGGSAGAAGSVASGSSGGAGGSASSAGGLAAGGSGGAGSSAGAGGRAGVGGSGGTLSSSSGTKAAGSGGNTGTTGPAKSSGGCSFARSPSSDAETLTFALAVFLAASRRRRPR